MKLHLKKVVFVLIAVVALATPLQAQTKVGSVDLKKLFDGYWKTKQADANLKDSAGELEKKRKGMVDDYQKANEDYKKLLETTNDQAVSADEREKRKKTAEAKLLEIKEIESTITQFNRSAQGQIMEQQRQMRDKILKEIREAVDAKSKAHGFAFVIDTAAETVNNTPFVLFNSGENDITEEVLKHINSTSPAELPKATDSDKKK